MDHPYTTSPPPQLESQPCHHHHHHKAVKLIHLPLRPSTLSTLLRGGFVTASDVDSSKKEGGLANLAAELGDRVTLEEAAAIADEVETATHHNHDHDEPQTAAALLSTLASGSGTGHTNPTKIVSFCQAIDRALGGGFGLGEGVYELVGGPGVGKTQLCAQLCVDVTIPHAFGGVEGQAVYIDTEGSFAPERCHAMAESLFQHLNGSLNTNTTTSSTDGRPHSNPYTVATILSRIHVCRVYDTAALTATVRSLPTLMESLTTTTQNTHNLLPNVNVKLVIVDSVAFPFRSLSTNSGSVGVGVGGSGSGITATSTGAVNPESGWERTRSLVSLASYLAELSSQHNLAVVVVNQMTTDSHGTMVPALGESWAHAVTTRIVLSCEEEDCSDHDGNSRPRSRSHSVQHRPSPRRHCTLVKSPYRPPAVVSFAISHVGVRDVPPAEEEPNGTKHPHSHPHPYESVSPMTAKRLRLHP